MFAPPLSKSASKIADRKFTTPSSKDGENTQTQLRPSQRPIGKQPGQNGPPSALRPSMAPGLLSASGQPLDGQTRAFFESRFQQDFSGVTVHADAAAARSAQEVGAPAYTFGSHLVFGAGRYAPESPRGRALIAHELAHAVQQRGGPAASPTGPSGLPRSTAAQEHEAEQAGAAVVSQRRPALTTGAPAAIACAPDDEKKLHSSEDLGDVIFKFYQHNNALGEDVLRRIRNGIVKATYDSKTYEVAYAFFDYYSGWFGGTISLMSPEEATKASKVGRVAETPAGGSTKIHPDVLGYSDVQIADLLLHEFSHTGHDTNDLAGSKNVEEGQSYGIEYFYAEVAGDTARMAKIVGIMGGTSVLGVGALAAAQQPEFQEQFQVTYALMTAFREVVTKGTSPHLPFPDLTSAKAQLLEAEVETSFQHPSADLSLYITYVKAHLASFTLPPI